MSVSWHLVAAAEFLGLTYGELEQTVEAIFAALAALAVPTTAY